MISMHFAAFSTSSTLCTSVVVAILSSSPTSFSIFNAISSPIPVNESNLVLLAFLYDPLKINGISNLSVILLISLAILKTSSLDSIMQGPAIKKKLFLSKFLILRFLPFSCRFHLLPLTYHDFSSWF